MLLVYDARGGRAVSINAEGTAPKLATIEWYRANQGGKIPVSDTLLSGTVPGVVDAWYILLDRWGTMSFAQVLAPAIEMAARGFPINDRLAAAISELQRSCASIPRARASTIPDGKAPKAGEMFSNPDLAATLAETGGGRARRGVQGTPGRPARRPRPLLQGRYRARDGRLLRRRTAACSATRTSPRYTAKVEEPVSADYRGYQVYKNPSARQGPAELFALNILESYDLKKLGHNSAEYIHAGVEAIKLAFADREHTSGDMDFIRIPFAGLLSKDYARERRKLIDPEKASLELRPGAAGEVRHGPPAADRHPYSRERATRPATPATSAWWTSSATSSPSRPACTPRFGTNVVMGGLGFSFNCRGDYFSLIPGHANALAPGKRPRSTLQSTLVLKDGRPVMVTGSPGGDDQCMRTMQTFLNIVEFGMNVQQAIEAPRWSTRSFPQSYFPHTMYPGEMSVEERIPESVRAELLTKGHKLKVAGPWSLGANAAIVIDSATGVLSAGADPRCDAYALAW